MIAWGACADPERAADPAGSAAGDLAAEDLTIDALAAPRDDNPLIAGEAVRIGVRIHGGTPPYTGRVTAERQGTRPAGDAPAPLDADLPLGGDTARIRDLELATRATLDARALSGVYRLRATVADARGRRATAYSGDFTLIGRDAEIWADADAAAADVDAAADAAAADADADAAAADADAIAEKKRRPEQAGTV